MPYVKIDWTEGIAITAARFNHTETQYDEFYSVYNGHNHDSRYYTESEADARFFNSGNDGPGTTLDADTVDGYDTDAIEAGAIPRGAIGIWSGSYESIPSGWVACNGFGSTPDLRNRLVVGAGGSYSKGDTGGYATRTPTGNLTVATHAITVDEMPEHDHSYTDYYSNMHTNILPGSSWVAGPTFDDKARVTATADGADGDPHGHSGSTIAFNAYNNMPPYHALWFIMRELAS